MKLILSFCYPFYLWPEVNTEMYPPDKASKHSGLTRLSKTHLLTTFQFLCIRLTFLRKINIDFAQIDKELDETYHMTDKLEQDQNQR